MKSFIHKRFCFDVYDFFREQSEIFFQKNMGGEDFSWSIFSPGAENLFSDKTVLIPGLDIQ